MSRYQNTLRHTLPRRNFAQTTLAYFLTQASTLRLPAPAPAMAMATVVMVAATSTPAASVMVAATMTTPPTTTCRRHCTVLLLLLRTHRLLGLLLLLLLLLKFLLRQGHLPQDCEDQNCQEKFHCAYLSPNPSHGHGNSGDGGGNIDASSICDGGGSHNDHPTNHRRPEKLHRPPPPSHSPASLIYFYDFSSTFTTNRGQTFESKHLVALRTFSNVLAFAMVKSIVGTGTSKFRFRPMTSPLIGASISPCYCSLSVQPS
ncbi:unnamed protein product [Schistocephalus solidus]|uniref:Uncharacterized protein n=1 Tax=Schistocephalus solidus TaxID=70667 RepID=A0A183SKC1_SCHSO|nr:unnamed protein product [Schistocephalus solidus]